jgi:hypothetical protein
MGQSEMAVAAEIADGVFPPERIWTAQSSFLLRRSREAIYAEMNTHAISSWMELGKKEKTMRVGEQQ